MTVESNSESKCLLEINTKYQFVDQNINILLTFCGHLPAQS